MYKKRKIKKAIRKKSDSLFNSIENNLTFKLAKRTCNFILHFDGYKFVKIFIN